MDLDDYVALERPVIEQIIKETRARQGNVPRRKPPKTPDSGKQNNSKEMHVHFMLLFIEKTFTFNSEILNWIIL